MRPLSSLFVIAAVLTGPAAANALSVPLDHSRRLSVAGAAASVVVGNPAIADVTVVDSHNVYVLGRALGSTNLVVLDRLGRPLFSGEVDVTVSGTNVSVYRGHDRTSAACDPGCVETAAASPGSHPAGVDAPAEHPAAPTIAPLGMSPQIPPIGLSHP